MITTNQQMKTAELAADKQQRIAHESLQQNLYNDFIDNIYQLYQDGELNESHNPWAFANARYRAVHRQLDTIRKAHILQFLREKELIGRGQRTTGCEQEQSQDIIRLNGLNFDHVHLYSEIGKISQLDFRCVDLNRVSLVNAIITDVDMSGASFEGSNLNGASFIGSSLDYAKFNGTQMDGIDLRKSTFKHAEFINVDLSNAKLTEEQIRQSTFINTTMPYQQVFTTSTKSITSNSVRTTTDEMTSYPSHYNSTFHRWFAERKNVSMWELIEKQLNDQDMMIVANIVKENRQILTYINLSFNHTGEEGVRYLANVIENNTALTILNLSKNQIGKIGSQHLFDVLKTNAMLTTLHLNDNNIGENGGTAIADALRTNSVLTTLYLTKNKIGNKGVMFFTESLRNNTGLTILDLRDNQIYDNSAQYLLDILQNNAIIQMIYVLEGNSFSQEISEQLRNQTNRIM